MSLVAPEPHLDAYLNLVQGSGFFTLKFRIWQPLPWRKAILYEIISYLIDIHVWLSL